MTKQIKCPVCLGPIKKITNTSGWMNDYQFDAVKAGDYYCPTCPGNDRGKVNNFYLWTSELLDTLEFYI